MIQVLIKECKETFRDKANLFFILLFPSLLVCLLGNLLTFMDKADNTVAVSYTHLHINKFDFKVPFVCGARNIGEALRRIGEGAAMIRTKGEAGTGNVVEAVRHMRSMMASIRQLTNLPKEELMTFAKENDAPYELVVQVAETGKLPVVNFAAGGIATPADAALMMQLGSEGIFVGSGIFKSSNPVLMAKAIVKATAFYNDPAVLAEVSEGLGDAMRGIELSEIPDGERMAQRGW